MDQTANWEGRYKIEAILEVGCPHCGALPNRFCNRDGERLRGHAAELRAQGTPPSHQERMWLRQGHDVAELAQLRAKSQPVKYDRLPRKAAENASRDTRIRCHCSLPAMPVRGVTQTGRDFTGWGCPVWKCGFERITGA